MKVHPEGGKPLAVAEPMKGRQLPCIPEQHLNLGIHVPCLVVIHICNNRDTVLRLK